MTLWQLDKGTGAVVATFPLSGGSGAGLYGGLAVYGGKLYRGTSSASVDVYDLATKQYESTFYVATAIYNMAFNGQDYCISSNSSSVYCYTLPSVSCSAGDDCDDTNGALHPTGLPEVCDGTDDNCNTGVDEGCDDDGDGYCDATLAFSGSAPVCPLGGNDCDDSDPSLSPTGAPEATCDGLDENCNGAVDEGCDDDGDGYCDTSMAVGDTAACPGTGSGPSCAQVSTTPTYIGNVVNMDTQSHGGGYSPFAHEYWYPVWSGGTVYRYDESYQFLGTFQSQASQIMQLWGDTDGSYYTANYSYNTISKHQGMGGPLVWTTNLGTTAGGVTADASYVWAMDVSSSTLWQLDKANGSILATHTLGGTLGGSLLGGLATVGGKLYRGDDGGVVNVFNLGTMLWESSFNVATSVYNMAFNGEEYCISANSSSVYCYAIATTVCTTGDDCDDGDPTKHPTAIEACDGVDQSCEGTVDEGCDDDGDGFCDGNLAFAGSPSICPQGGGDCDDSNAALSPTGLPETSCDGIDENCNLAIDEGCDDDGDGYCDPAMAVGDVSACPNTGYGPGCVGTGAPTFIGSVINMDTHSHGGGFSPYHHEYWYPSWGSNTVYRYDLSYQFLGTFTSGTSYMMQLWGDTDGTYYTADWGNATITKYQGMGGAALWSTSIGATASAVTADANYVWAMDYYSLQLRQLDKTTGALLNTFTLPSGGSSDTYGGLAVHGGKLYRGGSAGVVDVYNLQTKQYLASFNVATSIYNMAFNGQEYCISANSSSVYCYTLPTVSCPSGDDCNDNDASLHPTNQAEACDDVDNNCNAAVDEGCDADGDGFCNNNMAIVGTPAVCVNGLGDCDDSNAALAPTGLPETTCDAADENCNGTADEGCDDDGDGFCDAGMAVTDTSVCPNTGGGANCSAVPGTPTYIGQVVNMDTRSHGGGYSPFYEEYWYPEWSGSTVYRYNESYQLVGTFSSGASQIMQLWGDTDGSYYTANWGYGTIAKHQGPGGPVLWSTYIGTTASGVTADADHVWAMDPSSSTLWQLDKSTGAIVGTHYLTGTLGTTMYGGLVALGGKLYRGDAGAVVNVFDLTTKQWESSFNVATSVYNMAFNGEDYCLSANSSSVYCYTIATHVCTTGDDCDDGSGAVSPGAVESCDGADQTCDGTIDEGCDDDGDGFCDGSLGFSGSPPICPAGGSDCNDDDATKVPTGVAETVCDGVDENCNSVVDEGCDDDGDGYCDSAMAVLGTSACPNTGAGANCTGVGSPTYIGNVITMDTQSHGGGYSPFHHEYWYPGWSGSTVYRYDANYQFLGTFQSQASQIMQLWGDTDGTYYTANWGAATISKHQGMGGPIVWTTSIGATASAVTADAHHVWAMDYYSLTLRQLDKTTGTLLATFSLPSGGSSDTYGGLAVYSGKLYRGGSAGVVDVYDLATKQYLSSFNVATSVYNMAFNGHDYCISANSSSVYCYTLPLLSCTSGDDCNDASAAVSPGAPEVCDGLDQTCEGTIDEGCDDDGDGFCDGALGFSGAPPICPGGAGDCDDDDALLSPTGVPETACDGIDENCNSVTDEGCDDDGDGYCDSGMSIVDPTLCPNTALGPNCAGSGQPPTFIGSVINMDTRSHGGGYSPLADEYWYPEWAGSTVYRYDTNYQLLGTFQSGSSQIMQLWGESDGTYYTANWGYATITKHQGANGPVLWSTNIGTTASAVTTDGSYVWAMDPSSATLWQLDKNNGAILATHQLSGGQMGTLYGALAAVSGKLYRGNTSGVVDVYDLGSKQWESSFNTGTNIYNMAWNGQDYCVSANSSAVYCYSLSVLVCTVGDDCNDMSSAVGGGC
jgi:hypothetical protein